RAARRRTGHPARGGCARVRGCWLCGGPGPPADLGQAAVEELAAARVALNLAARRPRHRAGRNQDEGVDLHVEVAGNRRPYRRGDLRGVRVGPVALDLGDDEEALLAV